MRRLRAGNRHWHNHCGSEVRGKWAPRREVGKMGYLMMGIALVVLAVIAAVRTRTGQA
jgi:hypothetical protein